MSKTSRIASALLVAGGLLGTPTAYASQGFSFSYQRDYRNFDRRAYDNGYRQGLEHGGKDARRGREFAYARDGEYRDADRGYNRSYGSKDDYRRVFRQGYIDGYTEGYRGSRLGGFNDRRGPFPPYRSDDGRYDRDGGLYRDGGFYRGSIAAQNGYRDGFEVGRNDARDRESYDPRRAKRYREGDHDYESRYGSRDAYKQEYRAAFQQGYEQGFRDYRR